ncbi:hypothetical protein Y013_20900 [Rhodococcus pyridinivorans SB3094]|uniref:Uncharacterized protein n=1 Tax=Rhodococcus pyridinivorans SB3094 TaxID=1435356 RepID=V9XHH0_9NOCA|nr:MULTISPECIES: hypothetical protein [Rhodococcus]AHD22911.1 hypothetical protein Y013_20900 [Rhodococcus pyridinivorans SB3094]MCT7290644.1 hypothetical protein [Rhodococcus sp. PAE-6]
MHFLPDGEHRHRFLAALRVAGLGVEELWLRYFTLGGEVGRVEIEAYLNGLLPLPCLQHDLIAHAINERLDEIAPPRAPYSAELPVSLPEGNGVHGKDDPEGVDSHASGEVDSPGANDEVDAEASGNDVDEEPGRSQDPEPDSNI